MVSLSDVRALVDECRATCLWFLRADYYPTTSEECLRVLDLIQKHAGRDGFQRAGELKRCLSQVFSATSAASLPSIE